MKSKNQIPQEACAVWVYFALFVSLALSQAQEVRSPTPEEASHGKILLEINRLCREQKFEEARAAVTNWASQGANREAGADELKGMVEVYAKHYPEAERHFRSWLKREPDSHVPRFNLGESLLLQKRYQDALSEFAAVEATQRESNAPVADLAKFKQVVCHLLLVDASEAITLTESLASNPPRPAYRYSQIALLYWDRKSVKAREELRKCGEELPPEVNDLYLDTFLEMGWAKQDPNVGPLILLRP